MAIFVFDLETVSRRESGCAMHSLAYATGTRQIDERTGRVYNFAWKRRDVLAHGKVGPADWQATERAEKRWDAKVARTIILALPHELPLRALRRLVRRFCAWLRRFWGMACEWAIHAAPNDPRNRHAHLVLTTRVVDEKRRARSEDPRTRPQPDQQDDRGPLAAAMGALYQPGVSEGCPWHPH